MYAEKEVLRGDVWSRELRCLMAVGLAKSLILKLNIGQFGAALDSDGLAATAGEKYGHVDHIAFMLQHATGHREMFKSF